MNILIWIIACSFCLVVYYVIGMAVVLFYTDESGSDLAIWIEDVTNGDSFAAFSGIVIMWPLLLLRIIWVVLWWLLRNLGGSASILGTALKFVINLVRMK